MSRIDPAELPELPVAFMNADHQREIGLVNDLADALARHAGGDAATLEPVLGRLATLAVQTRQHFLREEAALRVARFPGWLAHRAEHDRILEEMDREARWFRAHGDVERLSRYLFEALPARYRTHATAMDLQAARHLAEREAAAPL